MDDRYLNEIMNTIKTNAFDYDRLEEIRKSLIWAALQAELLQFEIKKTNHYGREFIAEASL